ncbi:hypothetical protein T440DRAFT_301209 [Plenodomus tracheiphilus IPT5]|uniref:Uncharacterized protein n=1 Tax=Plenodomus tracheiphilus IPT5 TaxID=1408161 RepID=A0A6A7ANW9_9PLEO|nr:hypothetical protein T440DRAFT_301209 [Plenodomus tracheiphilus IPT5]
MYEQSGYSFTSVRTTPSPKSTHEDRQSRRLRYLGPFLTCCGLKHRARELSCTIPMFTPQSIASCGLYVMQSPVRCFISGRTFSERMRQISTFSLLNLPANPDLGAPMQSERRIIMHMHVPRPPKKPTTLSVSTNINALRTCITRKKLIRSTLPVSRSSIIPDPLRHPMLYPRYSCSSSCLPCTSSARHCLSTRTLKTLYYRCVEGIFRVHPTTNHLTGILLLAAHYDAGDA